MGGNQREGICKHGTSALKFPPQGSLPGPDFGCFQNVFESRTVPLGFVMSFQMFLMRYGLKKQGIIITGKATKSYAGENKRTACCIAVNAIHKRRSMKRMGTGTTPLIIQLSYNQLRICYRTAMSHVTLDRKVRQRSVFPFQEWLIVSEEVFLASYQSKTTGDL